MLLFVHPVVFGLLKIYFLMKKNNGLYQNWRVC